MFIHLWFQIKKKKTTQMKHIMPLKNDIKIKVLKI